MKFTPTTAVCQAFQFDKCKNTEETKVLFKHKDVFRDFVRRKIENVMTDKLTPVGEVESSTLSDCPPSPQHLLPCGKILAPYVNTV